jgi:hypothetical protein
MPTNGRRASANGCADACNLSAPNIHSHCLGDAEYIVDRRGLDRVDLMKSYDPE